MSTAYSNYDLMYEIIQGKLTYKFSQEEIKWFIKNTESLGFKVKVTFHPVYPMIILDIKDYSGKNKLSVMFDFIERELSVLEESTVYDVYGTLLLNVVKPALFDLKENLFNTNFLYYGGDA